MKEELHPKMYVYKRLVDAKVFIDNHYHEKIDLDQIAHQANFSKYHFIRLFKSAFGLSPHQYLIQVRLLAAKKMLKGDKTVKEVCFSVGFESVPSFISLFKKQEHMTPYEYVKKNKALKERKSKNPLSLIPNCFAENLIRNNSNFR